MAYQGNAPATVYTSTTKDTFSGDGSTTAFTLSRAATQNAIRVVVANVVQDPGVAYTCVGATLTFTSAPPSGTNNIYVVHLGPPAATISSPLGGLTDVSNATPADGNALVYESATNQWKPGTAGATGAGGNAIFWENDQTVTADYTITNGKNAMSAGPITIASGVTVTVGTGETWTVV